MKRKYDIKRKVRRKIGKPKKARKKKIRRDPLGFSY